MKKINSLILLIFCFSIVLGQKKKQKSLPPPKMEVIKPSVAEATNKVSDIQYVSPPALPNDHINIQKPKIIENLNLDSNTKRCACDNVAIILGADKFGEGFMAKDFGLRGNVKSIKNVEKRDTLVGYSETLSKGNIVEMTFSDNGFLQTHIKDMMDKVNNSQGFKSISQLFYNPENQIIESEICLVDMKNLMAKNHFLYNEMGLYEVKTTDKNKKPIQKTTTFDCYKTDNQFFVVKKELYTERNRETNEMLVFNSKDQLIKKQEISNNDGDTTNNKTKTFVYNNLGLLTEENFLKNDGTIKSYIHHIYNPKGDVIKSVYKNGDYIVYDYKYDNQNNWIWKQKTEFEKSRFSNEMQIDERLTWDRSIVYY